MNIIIKFTPNVDDCSKIHFFEKKTFERKIARETHDPTLFLRLFPATAARTVKFVTLVNFHRDGHVTIWWFVIV